MSPSEWLLAEFDRGVEEGRVWESQPLEVASSYALRSVKVDHSYGCSCVVGSWSGSPDAWKWVCGESV